MPHRRTKDLNQWTEYCSELYNHKSNGEPLVLNCPQTHTDDDHPILRKEVEGAVQSLKKGKSAEVNNIPAELVQAGGGNHRSHDILQQDLADGRMASSVDPVLGHHIPKKGNLQQCHDYRTMSLISHPSKVMLKIILNRLKRHAEKIIVEKRAGFRAGRSTTEQIFNLRILCEKILSTSKTCLHRLQKGLRQGLACSFVGNHEEVQHQRQPYPSHQTPLR